MNFLLSALFSATAHALAPSCYNAPVLSRIVGGTAAGVREFPFLASVQTPTSLCGGSLIAPGWVLTAAHCGSPTTVIMGMYSLKGAATDPCTERISVARAIPHPNYVTGQQKYDIMLLQLSTPSTYSPIKLWDGNPPYGAVGSVETVAGWGTTSDTAEVPNDTLLKVDVPIQSNSKCNSQYGGLINNDMLCAGYDQGGKDSCQGDSGGPLFARDTSNGQYIQVGIVSFGRACAEQNAYGVYTRVPSYLDWICRTSGLCNVAPTPRSPTFAPPTFAPPTFAPRTSAPTRAAPVLPAPTPAVVVSAPTSSLFHPFGPPPTPRCRTCVWCFSTLPICKPAPKKKGGPKDPRGGDDDDDEPDPPVPNPPRPDPPRPDPPRPTTTPNNNNNILGINGDLFTAMLLINAQNQNQNQNWQPDRDPGNGNGNSYGNGNGNSYGNGYGNGWDNGNDNGWDQGNGNGWAWGQQPAYSVAPVAPVWTPSTPAWAPAWPQPATVISAVGPGYRSQPDATQPQPQTQPQQPTVTVVNQQWPSQPDVLQGKMGNTRTQPQVSLLGGSQVGASLAGGSLGVSLGGQTAAWPPQPVTPSFQTVQLTPAQGGFDTRSAGSTIGDGYDSGRTGKAGKGDTSRGKGGPSRQDASMSHGLAFAGTGTGIGIGLGR